MFEKIPKPNDQEMDTWEESSLEGVYKFICKYYRAMTTIYHANRQGLYKNIDTELMMNSLTRCEFECLKLLHMNNTMPNRHNVMALLMDELKNISKVCKVGELTVKHHEEEINHANPNAGVIEVLEKDDNTNPGIDIVCKKYMTLVSPFVPYITEQAWKLYSQDSLAVEQKWEYNDLADEDIVSIPVQVNGKAKAVLSITRNTDADTVKSEAFKLVDRILQDKEYKCIYVENKIINFVY